MNSTDQLDSFETALLAELRREVAQRPAPTPAPRRHPRRRLKIAVAGAVATAAATVAAVGLTGGGPTASPAFAVEGNPDGSVDIAILRLDDAEGLEAALADHGIDATVHFVPTADGQVPEFPMPESSYLSPKDPQYASCGIDNGPGPAMLLPVKLLEKTHTMPSGPEFDGAEYVLQIRAGSPLFERPTTFAVGSPGSFSIAYPSAVPGKNCGFGSSQWFDAPGAGKVK